MNHNDRDRILIARLRREESLTYTQIEARMGWHKGRASRIVRNFDLPMAWNDETAIPSIKELYESGWLISDIAQHRNVPESQIADIVLTP